MSYNSSTGEYEVITSQVGLLADNGATVNIIPNANTANWNLTLPIDDGAVGSYLQSDGSGNTSWSSSTSGPANALETSGSNVIINTTAPVGANYILKTTSTTNATWQLESGGGGSITASSTDTLTNKTLTDSTTYLNDNSDGTKKAQFQCSSISTATTRTFTLPDANVVLVGDTNSQTLTNKTLTIPVISAISNTGIITLPTSTDVLVGRATTDTLTNKTLTNPIISTISNTGTLTLPISTDTLVGRNTVDILSNKTLNVPIINPFSVYRNTSVASGTQLGHLTDNSTFNITNGETNGRVILATNNTRLDVNTSNTTINSPSTVNSVSITDTYTSSIKPVFLGGVTSGGVYITSADTGSLYTLKLPGTVASATQVLTDVSGNGNLTWETPTGGSFTPSSSDTLTNKSFPSIVLNGSSSGILTLFPTSTTTSHSLTFPSAQGGASTVLTNDGSGILSWASGVPSSDTASNVGSGDGWFKTKAGGDFQFKSMIGTSNQISITNNTNDLTINVGSNIVDLTTAQTLTNKTLTTPIISTISNTGTLTLPTSTDTLVARNTVDTLTYKTMTGDTNVLTASVLKSATTEIVISSATAPTAGQVLVASSSTNADWADVAVVAGIELFFNNNTGSNIALIQQLSNVPDLGIESSVVSAVDNTVDIMVQSFITDVGYPSLTALPAGSWDFNVYSFVNAGTTTSIYAKIYKVAFDNTSPALLATTSLKLLPIAVALQLFNVVIGTTACLITDRIRIELWVNNTSITSRNATTYFDGLVRASHVNTPLAIGTGWNYETLTLTNKTLVDSSTYFSDDLDATKKFQFQCSGITTATTRTLSVPDSDITLVGTTNTQTLTNKTLTSPIISTISNTGTITLPTSTTTLVGTGTSDSLNNKQLIDTTCYFTTAADNTKKIKFYMAGANPNSSLSIISQQSTGSNINVLTPDLLVDDTFCVIGKAQTLTNKTLTSPIISTISNTGTLTLPTSTTTLVGIDTTNTLTNKTLTDSTTSFNDNLDGTKQFQFQCSGITTATTRTLSIPDASTTIVGTDVSQTLTNKTLTLPIISSISNTGILTLPTATTTLIGTGTTDTLTNKTLTATSNDISANKLTSSTGVITVNSTVPTSGQVLTATSGTVATWQTPSGGGSSDPRWNMTTDSSFIMEDTSPNISLGDRYILTDGTTYFKYHTNTTNCFLMVSSSADNTGWSKPSISSALTFTGGYKKNSAMIHNGQFMLAYSDGATIKLLTTTGLTYPFTFNASVTIASITATQVFLTRTADATSVPVLVCYNGTNLVRYIASNAGGTAWGATSTIHTGAIQMVAVVTRGTGTNTKFYIGYTTSAYTPYFTYTTTNTSGGMAFQTPFVVYSTTSANAMNLSFNNNGFPMMVFLTTINLTINYSSCNSITPTATANWTTSTVYTYNSGIYNAYSMVMGIHNTYPVIGVSVGLYTNVMFQGTITNPTGSTEWTKSSMIMDYDGMPLSYSGANPGVQQIGYQNIDGVSLNVMYGSALTSGDVLQVWTGGI